MRIIKITTLKSFWEKEPFAEQPLLAWVQEIEKATWQSHNELKNQFKSASIINQKRVVFNIHGNRFRLVTSFNYKLQLVFIIWIGSHSEYDKINVETVKYVKTTKN
jgi:mRNA interferase HigB